jgi:hypothetical protein
VDQRNGSAASGDRIVKRGTDSLAATAKRFAGVLGDSKGRMRVLEVVNFDGAHARIVARLGVSGFRRVRRWPG